MAKEQEEKMYEISQETIDTFNEVFKKKAFSIDIKLAFIGNAKQKQMVKIRKISDEYAFILDKQILVSFNEELMVSFDDEAINILIEQEIDKIEVNFDKGTIKTVKPDFNTFSSIISKYGIEKVSRANQVSDLLVDQLNDAKADFIK